jgi:hypothetical protein
MATYWSALAVAKQVCGELGLPQPTSIVGVNDTISTQIVSLLNSAGNELLTYYPWEQFVSTFNVATVGGQDSYTLPTDLAYFTDQTQWDNTNHWPLSGPKSAQEWAFLKGSLVAPIPRIRYRIAGDSLKLFPTPGVGASSLSLSMEYISCNWIAPVAGGETSMIVLDTDILQYNPWLLVKFVKFKFYELKGFPTLGVQADFMRIFNSLTGKDTGADKLSLVQQPNNAYIGVGSIPDGNWNQ